jgi:hypothetical protein
MNKAFEMFVGVLKGKVVVEKNKSSSVERWDANCGHN